MKTLELTDEQIHLVILGLQTAAVVGRQSGHKGQADSFSALSEAVRLQSEAQDEDEEFDDPGENRTFLDD